MERKKKRNKRSERKRTSWWTSETEGKSRYNLCVSGIWENLKKMPGEALCSDV